MDKLIQHYCSWAHDIAQQFDSGDVDFADLTGLCDEFAASFTDQIRTLPKSSRHQCCTLLENRLTSTINHHETTLPLGQALDELRVSINRTPIY